MSISLGSLLVLLGLVSGVIGLHWLLLYVDGLLLSIDRLSILGLNNYLSLERLCLIYNDLLIFLMLNVSTLHAENHDHSVSCTEGSVLEDIHIVPLNGISYIKVKVGAGTIIPVRRPNEDILTDEKWQNSKAKAAAGKCTKST